MALREQIVTLGPGAQVFITYDQYADMFLGSDEDPHGFDERGRQALWKFARESGADVRKDGGSQRVIFTKKPR